MARSSRSRSRSPRGGEWSGWCGREATKWVVEGGVRVKMVDGEARGLDYRSLGGVWVRYGIEDGMLVKEKEGRKAPCGEVHFTNGVPDEDPPQSAVARVVCKRLMQLAIKTHAYRDAQGYATLRSRSRRSAHRTPSPRPLSPLRARPRPSQTDLFCPQCGQNLAAPTPFCPQTGTPHPRNT